MPRGLVHDGRATKVCAICGPRYKGVFVRALSSTVCNDEEIVAMKLRLRQERKSGSVCQIDKNFPFAYRPTDATHRELTRTFIEN